MKSERAMMRRISVFHGRRGTKDTNCFYRLYLRAVRGDSVVGGVRFVGYSRSGPSKCSMVLGLLREHRDRAFYTMDIYEMLQDRLKRKSAVMDAVRYYRRKGLVYVRGYRNADSQTPFQRGFIVTWIDQDKPREVAIKEAVERTEKFLDGGEASSYRLSRRLKEIRDIILASTNLGELASYNYLRSQLGCTDHELNHTVQRMHQLYREFKTVKLFGAYNFFYHSSMPEEDLKMALEAKCNYLRKTQGRANRIGHNWEAAVEWFIDHFIEHATFWEQKHQGGKGRMDPRRITLYLMKSVGHRRNRAEVDRVWTVSNILMRDPTTYVLSCKWGLVRKDDLDDFMEVLKWSKEFGSDSKDGRVVKNNVIGVFAAGAFNPKENVKLNGGAISLPSYAKRLSINIIKSADLNERLRERGVNKEVTVQKVCRVASDELQVRKLMDEIWSNPQKAEEILVQATHQNQDIYQFEKMLEEKGLDINMIVTHDETAATTDEEKKDETAPTILTKKGEGKKMG